MNLAEKKSHDVLDQMACLKYKCLVMKMRKPTSIYNNFTSFTHSKNIDIMFVYYDKGHSKLGTLKSHHGIFRPQSDVISKIYPCQTHPYERSAKPQLKNAISGQSYRFWDFTISFYSISWLHHPHPLANCMRKAFLHLHFASWASLTALRFLFQRFNCMVGVVWYLPTQLQITVAPSFLQLRNKFWIQFVGGNPGELSQRHAPCLSFTRQRLRSKPSTWFNAFALAIFI